MSMTVDGEGFSRGGLLQGHSLDAFRDWKSAQAKRPQDMFSLMRATQQALDGVALTSSVLATGYVAKNWNLWHRLQHFLNHRKIVNAIGGAVDVQREEVRDLIKISCVGDEYRIKLDRAVWFRKEGQLVFSLWDGIDRIFSVSFCLSFANGKRVAYVGAIQGRCEPNILQRYRDLTKAVHGMRARDFVVELFKIFCRSIDVEEILAVSIANKHNAQANGAPLKLCYDEIWRDRGGEECGDGFFALAVTSYRDGDEQRAKKRACYVKRYAMFDQIEADMKAALRYSPHAKVQSSEAAPAGDMVAACV